MMQKATCAVQRCWAIRSRGPVVAVALLFLAFSGCGGSDALTSWDTGSGTSVDVRGVDVGSSRDVRQVAITVRIVSPAAGTVVLPGATLDLVGDVTVLGAGDLRVEDLRAEWRSDLEGVLDVGYPNSLGRVATTDIALSAGTHAIRLTITDDKTNTTVWDELAVIVRSRPTAPAIHIDPSEPTTQDDLTALIDVASVADPGTELVYTWRWRKNGEIATGQTTATLPAVNTRKGEIWEAAVTPASDGVQGPLVRATVTVRNSRPVVTGATLFPSVVHTGTTLRCQESGADDADGDAVVFRYAWQVNGDDVVGAVEDTLVGGHFARGDVVRCVVTPDDGETTGDAVSSAPVRVENTAPFVEAVTLTPSTGDSTTLFTCVAAGLSDADGDEVQVGWSWYLDGERQLGITEATWTPSNAARGQRLSCGAQPKDGFDDGLTVQSQAVSLGNTPPTLETVVIRPASTNALGTLECIPEDGADLDGDEITYTFAWYVGEEIVEGAEESTLEGEGGAVFHEGDVVYCEATPFDGVASGPSVRSKNNARIGNAPPSVATVVVTPATGDVHTVFRCVYDGWVDPDTGDAEQPTYRWFRNGEVVDGATGAAYEGPIASFDHLSCEVTPSDGDDAGEAVSSDVVDIVDLPPSLTRVSIAPDSPSRATVLTCRPEGWVDAEGATPSYTFGWVVNGVEQPQWTGETLDGAALERADVVVCHATPSDGVQDGETVYSQAVSIGNAAPTVEDVRLMPGFGNHNTTFTCQPIGTNDLDDDAVYYTYSWSLNGELVDGVDTPTYTGVAFESGDRLSCSVIPTDGINEGAEVASNDANLFNALPNVTSVVVEPDPAYADDTLTCSPQGWVDSDGDEPHYRYSWLINGLALDDEVGEELSPGPFAKHDAVVCQVTPNDGFEDGPPRNSAEIVVENTVPVIGHVTVRGTAIDDLLWFRCSPRDVTDADGDVITFTYRWFHNGGEMEGQRDEVIPGYIFALEDTVQCEATPFDTEDWGAPVLSPVLDVENTPPTAQILRPVALDVGLQTYVRFLGRVHDLEDAEQDLLITWESSKDGILNEDPPQPDGTVAFATNELTQGIHTITLRVRDTLLAEGYDQTILVVKSECGTTGYVLDDTGVFWSDGFESGDLTHWNFDNRKFVVGGGFTYIMSGCDNPFEFLIDPVAAHDGELGLVVDLPESPTDFFSVSKTFGDHPGMQWVTVECWVYPVDRVQIQFGLYHDAVDGGQMHSAGVVLLTTDTSLTYVPPGPADSGSWTDPNGHALQPNRWTRLSIFRDIEDHQLLFYEDDREWMNQAIDDERIPTGFGIGMSSSGGATLGYIDDCSYVLAVP